MIRYGLIPEFVGRLPVLATLHELTEDALVRSSPAEKRPGPGSTSACSTSRT